MEAPVEIRYAGVVIGRTQEARGTDGDSSSLFLVVREPMPVGSVLHLRSGDREILVRVVHSVEASDPAACGVQVRPIGEAEEFATEWIPPPAPVAEKTHPVEKPAETTMPVIEVVPPKLAAPVAAEPVPTSVEPPTPVLLVEPALSAPELEMATQAAPAAEPAVASDEPEISLEVRPARAERRAPAPAPAPEPVAPPVTVAVEPAREAASGDAVPEAIPVAVGSSMTGALENAAAGASADESSEAAAAEATSEDLPPARPIAGPSGRRKTKRRR